MFDISWFGWILLMLGLTHLVITLVTVYFHRAMAHRAVTFVPRLNRICRFLAWFLIAMDPREFAAIHRKHHAHCDTDKDPHSPLRFGLARVVFGGLGLYQKEADNKETLDYYGKGLPQDPWESFYSHHKNLGIFLFAILLTGLWGGMGLLAWAVTMVWIPFWAAGIINGLGHAVGYRNFPTEDRSTNLIPWGIWLGGEELHNNHHADPSSPKFSSARFEFDLGWVYIRALRAMGWARLREVPGRLSWLEETSLKPVTSTTISHVLRARYAWLAHLHTSLTHDARFSLKTHGFRRWKDLSVLWDKGLDNLKGRHQRRLASAQENPHLQRLREIEVSLRTLWSERSHCVQETLQAWEQWLARARSEALPRLSQFCDRLTQAQWSPVSA